MHNDRSWIEALLPIETLFKDDYSIKIEQLSVIRLHLFIPYLNWFIDIGSTSDTLKTPWKIIEYNEWIWIQNLDVWKCNSTDWPNLRLCKDASFLCSLFLLWITQNQHRNSNDIEILEKKIHGRSNLLKNK